VSVVGSTNSGKTTVARALAARLGVVHVELDSIVHQADWQDLPEDEFLRRAAEATSGDGWVTCGNYQRVRETVIWPRADTVVWLDMPKSVVMRRVIWRTFSRAVARTPLWNGNRERLRSLLPWLREDSMVWWAWTNFDKRRRQMADAGTDPRWSHLQFIHLRSPAEVRAWLAAQPATIHTPGTRGFAPGSQQAPPS
jgi:adenylate kinase family enzyme